jgi:hypothetical protein
MVEKSLGGRRQLVILSVPDRVRPATASHEDAF